MMAVPFENLDIHRGVPIVLSVPAFYEKIVTKRRGGYCYELNGLFAWLLAERHGLEDRRDDVLREQRRALRLAARAGIASPAGEREQVLGAAVRTATPPEAALQPAAGEVPPQPEEARWDGNAQPQDSPEARSAKREAASQRRLQHVSRTAGDSRGLEGTPGDSEGQRVRRRIDP